MQMTGAEMLIKSMRDEGVEILFGYPGGVLLEFYDALFKSGMRHVLTRHEQATAHAADGYARATGRVGVCMATSGPGATNLVTGIATAYMDSVPIVAFTGQVPTHMIGGDAFQEADIVGVTRPITKHSYLVKKTEDIPLVVQEAFYIASSGRPGPVVVDLPKDVLAGKGKYRRADKVEIRGYKPKVNGHPGQLKRVINEVQKAKKPVIYAGGGVIISDATGELVKFAEMNRIPVTNTLLGLGGFPGDHPLFVGMLGMHGTYQANMTIHNSDLIIAIGARFDDRVTGNVKKFAPNARIVHVDIDPSAISKNIVVHVPVVGDVKNVLKGLNELQAGQESVWEEIRERWLNEVRDWGDERPLEYDRKSSILKPQYVVEKLNELAPDDAIIATEVGQNQMWVAQFYRFCRPRTLLSSGGLGTMGYGFPAAMGAQFAYPDRLVIDVAGDGSFQMNLQELATVAQHNLPVKVFILNNGFLGMVRQWQELFYGARYASTCLSSNPDFVKVAEAFGVRGIRIDGKAEVEAGIREALAHPGPVLVDCTVDREEGVYPMVPPGAGSSEMIFGPVRKKETKLKAVK
ncbi:MAG TPA: biosynthetic-type acetolactate synthase large subunit [Proteobacteria bacterium]|nr:acetolactate synthase large subunit [bacterium BMS3Abin14]HDL53793.1 biosynthetic-type acetolactate synthase large subunit [Pseudomonadota bacterium]